MVNRIASLDAKRILNIFARGLYWTGLTWKMRKTSRYSTHGTSIGPTFAVTLVFLERELATLHNNHSFLPQLSGNYYRFSSVQEITKCQIAPTECSSLAFESFPHYSLWLDLKFRSQGRYFIKILACLAITTWPQLLPAGETYLVSMILTDNPSTLLVVTTNAVNFAT